MTDEMRERFEKEAGVLHDRIHEVAALVDYHTRVEIGWAPEEAIPILADALEAAYQRGREAGLERAAQMADEWEISVTDKFGALIHYEDSQPDLAEAIRALGRREGE